MVVVATGLAFLYFLVALIACEFLQLLFYIDESYMSARERRGSFADFVISDGPGAYEWATILGCVGKMIIRVCTNIRALLREMAEKY